MHANLNVPKTLNAIFSVSSLFSRSLHLCRSDQGLYNLHNNKITTIPIIPEYCLMPWV